MRLTFKREDGTAGIRGMQRRNEADKLIEAVRKLAAYEDTGLEPEQVAALKTRERKEDGKLSPEEVWETMARVCDGECTGCPVAALNDRERGKCPWGSSYQDIRDICREARELLGSE